MDWNKFIQALMQTEETFVPMFIHNPKSQKIAGIVMMTEGAVATVLNQTGVIPTPAAPPAA